jgi:hypothetical protein
MRTLFRLWLVGSICWVGLAYWALKDESYQGLLRPVPWHFILGVPLGVFALTCAVLWAFGAFRRSAI